MLIHEAIEFAAVKHRNQVRKGTNTPYIVHPMEVMYILAGNGCDETVIAAGLLHDTVEDAGATLKEIEEKFGKEVADIVAAESEDKSKIWQERKQTTIDRLPNESFEAQLVCCADKLANVRSMYYDFQKIGEKLWERFNAPKEKRRKAVGAFQRSEGKNCLVLQWHRRCPFRFGRLRNVSGIEKHFCRFIQKVIQ